MFRKALQNSNIRRLLLQQNNLKSLILLEQTSSSYNSTHYQSNLYSGIKRRLYHQSSSSALISKRRNQKEQAYSNYFPFGFFLFSLIYLYICQNKIPVKADTQTVQISEEKEEEEERENERQSIWYKIKNFSFLGLETRKKTFFKYEKRIRMNSTPEKIFDYFSSIQQDGIKYMTSTDLVRALMPVYPPEGSIMERSGAFMGENRPHKIDTSFISVFDTDGDNLISFHEFILVLTLLSIPLQDVEEFFHLVDEDLSGTISLSEFMKIIKEIQNKSQQIQRNRDGLRTGLKTGNMWSEPHGLIAKFFGKDGKKELELYEFKKFLHDLQENLLNLEFLHYDYNNNGKINGCDFARSICCSASMGMIDHYLTKVSTMNPVFGNYQFSKFEFIEFHKLENFTDLLMVSLNKYEKNHGKIDVKIFVQLVKSSTGLHVTLKQAKIVMAIFGDMNGHLIINEFINVLENRSRGHHSVKLIK